MAQIHKKFTDDQIKNLLQRYLRKEIEKKLAKILINTQDRL